MSTSPEVSQYQAANAPESTFQPSVSSSDSDYSDEKQAVATYQSTYGIAGTSGGGNQAPLTGTPPYPTLSMAYTTAPDLMPQPQTNGSSGSGSSAPEPQFPVFIELGTLMSTEATFLDATQALVNEYENTLVPIVRSAMSSSTLFGQNVETSTGVAPGSKASEIYPTEEADPLDQEGVKFAAAVNPQMSYLLQQVGTMVEALGTFTAMINKAGQYYTDTDAQSAFPPPGLMEGPNPPTGPSTVGTTGGNG
jgi:hypothetical protein